MRSGTLLSEQGGHPAVICLARAAQVVLIVEVTHIATMLLDIDLSWYRMIHLSAWIPAATEHCDRAQRIPRQDGRPGAIAPLR